MSQWDSDEKVMERILCSLQKFDPMKESFIKWHDAVDHIFCMLDIKNNSKSNILLNILEPSVFMYLESHVEPENLFNIPYEMIVTILEEKFTTFGKFQSLMHRLTFRDQFKGESIENYYYTLKKLFDRLDKGPESKSCFLLRFIYGLENDELRENLIQMPDLTMYNAVRIAMEVESRNLPPEMKHSKEKLCRLLHELKEEEEREGQTNNNSKNI